MFSNVFSQGPPGRFHCNLTKGLLKSPRALNAPSSTLFIGILDPGGTYLTKLLQCKIRSFAFGICVVGCMSLNTLDSSYVSVFWLYFQVLSAFLKSQFIFSTLFNSGRPGRRKLRCLINTLCISTMLIKNIKTGFFCYYFNIAKWTRKLLVDDLIDHHKAEQSTAHSNVGCLQSKKCWLWPIF